MGHPDAELMRRWRHGDAAAFAAIVDRWQQPVARFLLRLTGRPDRVPDLCQEVFLRLIRAAPRYREDGRFSTWLFQIALNVARDVAADEAAHRADDDFLIPLCLAAAVILQAGEVIDAALKKIGKAPRGVLLYLAQEGRGIGIANKIAAYHLQDHGLDTVDANRVLGFPADLRSYKCAACMLRVLGVKSVRLMTNNPAKIEQLESYGLRVVDRTPLQVPATAANIRYLRTKKSRLAHLLETPVVDGPRARRRSGRR